METIVKTKEELKRQALENAASLGSAVNFDISKEFKK